MLAALDFINACFELFGGAFALLNVRRLLRDEKVRGVDGRVIAFFTVWGGWNLIYYPALGQSLSFYAGILLVVANVWYAYLMWYYIRRERKS